MDNPDFRPDPESFTENTREATGTDIQSPMDDGGGDAEEGGGPDQGLPIPCLAVKKPKGKMKKTYKVVKTELQSNQVTTTFFPPSGNTATVLTISTSIIAVFLVARSVLGPIAAPGGTIFALLVTILLGLILGEVVRLIGVGLSKLVRTQIVLPPLLGMLLVGILLKNVPYNFGQFGRAECLGNVSLPFVDSLNDVANLNDSRLRDSIDEGFIVEFNKASDHPDSRHGQLLDSFHNDHNIHEIHEHGMDQFPEHKLTEFPDHKIDHIHEIHRRSSEDHGSGQEIPEDTCKKRFIGHDLDPAISRTLRSFCLTVILLMAGLELDPAALKKLAGMVIRATLIPCIVEAVAGAILSHFILGFPWPVGFMFGFLLCGVSPAVIIPNIIKLSEGGYGVLQGIPTLAIATCSADDIVAIAGFGICLGITFNANSPILELAFHGPIEVIIGLVFGIGWGILAQWVPNRHHKNMVFFRFVILFSGGLIALFGAHLLHYDGAGGLATIILAFVASIRWRKEGWGDHNPVSNIFTKMWIILAPIIFCLIGTAIQVDKIDGGTLGYSILILILSFIIRGIGTFFALGCGHLNYKERIFLSLTWLPKASVQAALGPVFLDNAIRGGMGDDYIQYGEQILTMAVLSILISAPLGAILILALGPKLLHNDSAAIAKDAAAQEKDDLERNA